jgi:hypothetical protein
MKCQLPVLLLAISLASCHHGYEFRNISEFNLKPGALKDLEPIQLLYSSQGPGNNDNLDYYVQLIVVSQKTGDTVNVLTTLKADPNENNGDSIFYFGPDNLMTKVIQMKEEETKKYLNHLDSYKLKDIHKVANDPGFDKIARNHFPTVIGSFGKKGGTVPTNSTDQ